VAGEGRPVLAMLGRSDRRLSEAMRLHVGTEVTPGPGGLIGLELEFSVRTTRGGRVHFGSLIHGLGLDGTALDPGDPNAYRCSWGGVITADGAEAEIATPPVRTRPGFTARLQAWARTGEAELRRALPRGTGLDGYSAHFSAAMPAKLNDRVCRLYAETFAADLMLLMDRIDSPGLLVRPRPGRTELCAEFIEDERLAAAAAFVAGTTRACAAAVRRPGARTALPPRLDVRLARAVHRYGWYVDRRAFGTDLHAATRRALLPRAAGGTICAQSHLELAWAAARQALADDAAASDLQAAEAMVTGSLPLPAEHSHPDDIRGGQRGGDVRFPLEGTAGPDMPRLCAHVRPGFTLRPVSVTWDFTVFEATGPARSAYVCIPRDSLPGFAAALDEGALDDRIAAYLALTSRRRVLSAPGQTARPGIYDRMGAPAGLLAPERDPETGHHEPGEPGAKRVLARPGKRNRQDQEAPRKEQEARQKTRRFSRRAAVIGAAAAVVLAGASTATAMLSRAQSPSAGSPPVGSPPAVVSFQPPALSFPAVPVSTSMTKSVAMTNNGRSPAAITRISIGGPSRHDFSVSDLALLSADRRGGQAIHPAAQTPSCHRLVPHSQTCAITVVFTPSATGPRAASLEIYFASRQQPQEISLTGTGIPAAGTTPSTPGTTPSTPGTTPSTPGTTPSTPPTLTLPPDQTVEATGPDGATVTYTVSASYARDGILTPSCNPASGSTFALGPTTVTCSATDAHHNTATGSFTVTVQDTTPPSLNLPGNITAEATGPDGTAVTYTATATDLVDGSVPVSCSPESGSVFPLETTTVTCTATDAHHNTATGSFTVTVQDTTPPPLKLPGDITTYSTGSTGIAVTYTATATDLVDGSVPVSCSPESGSRFAIASTTVNCSATDAHHNTATGSFTVTVEYAVR
jgi:HYR domain